MTSTSSQPEAEIPDMSAWDDPQVGMAVIDFTGGTWFDRLLNRIFGWNGDEGS